MNLDEIINSMTPEVYQRLSTAVELGKWPDGVALTPEQKENSLQLPPSGGFIANALCLPGLLIAVRHRPAIFLPINA